MAEETKGSGASARVGASRDIKGSFVDLLQAIPNAIVVHRNSIVLTVNSAFERMFGIPQDQVVGRCIIDFVAESSEKLATEMVESVFAEHYEVNGRRADGSELIVEVFSVPTLYEGLPARLGLLSDVTQGKLAEQILQDSESRFRALTENSRDRIALLDASGVIIYASPSSTRIYGYTPEETIGRNAFDCVHPEDVDLVANTFQKILKQPGQAFHVEYRSRHKEGHYIWMDTTGHNALENPCVKAVVVNEREITERKRAEEEIYHLASIVESSDDAMIGSNLESEVVIWNQAAEKMFGYSCKEIVGRHISLLMPPEKFREMGELRDKIRDGERIQSLETVRMTKAGHRLEVCLTLFGARDVRTGRYTGAWAIVRDITEKKRLEREILTISEREQQRIGHDLHDSICQELIGAHLSLSSVVENLGEESHPLASRAARALAPIASAIAQGKNLAKSLFPVMLEEEGLVWALKNLAESTAAVSRTECVFTGNDSVLIRDNVVATHLYRIAQEAISNAIRHARPRRVSVALEATDGAVRLAVEDDGVGIEASPVPGMGMRIMQFRASAINARLEISRPAVGGHRVEVFLPNL